MRLHHEHSEAPLPHRGVLQGSPNIQRRCEACNRFPPRARFPDLPDLSTALETGRLTEAQEAAGWSDADFTLADVDFERTIPRPGKIFCIGVNYGGRNAEYTDSTSSNKPSVFVRFPESLTGHQQPLIRPPESMQLDCCRHRNTKYFTLR